MDRKGQAAMEFLMTYGWAILAAIIAIGVLAYFGVFSPGKYTTGSTVVNPPFYAQGGVVQADNVKVEVKNNGGEDYTISSFAVSPTSGTSGSCTTNTTDTTITAGSSAVLGVDCTGTPAAGNNFKGDLTIKYTRTGSSLEIDSTGTIAQKVTA